MVVPGIFLLPIRPGFQGSWVKLKMLSQKTAYHWFGQGLTSLDESWEQLLYKNQTRHIWNSA